MASGEGDENGCYVLIVVVVTIAVFVAVFIGASLLGRTK